MKPGWNEALAAARSGDIDAARAVIADYRTRREPFRGAADLLEARCLAEAGVDADHALRLARTARAASPGNQIAPQVEALALLESGDQAAAAAIFLKHRLPHDLNLLARLAIFMELELRPLPAALPEGWPAPWDDATEEAAAQTPKAKPDPRKLEQDFLAHKLTDVMNALDPLLRAGVDEADLAQLAGMAAAEAGDADRARIGLARALELEPEAMMARTYLGRVYWRLGWFELAEDLWRSLPVEGPDDFGRHYHLALAHAVQGRMAEARDAMGVAFRGFFIETREFYIERAFRRWVKAVGV